MKRKVGVMYRPVLIKNKTSDFYAIKYTDKKMGISKTCSSFQEWQVEIKYMTKDFNVLRRLIKLYPFHNYSHLNST